MRNYDIFISYRREGGYDTAKHLYDLLTRDGYRVSFDIDTLRSDDFDTQLYERINSCRDFILIVGPNTFDKCLDKTIPKEQDWLRCELAYALKKRKNIIPIFLSGTKGFPDGLPEDIAKVVKKNGPEFNRYYFDDFYRKLKKRFLHTTNIRRIFRYSFIPIMIVAICIIAAYYWPKRTDSQYEYKETKEFVKKIDKFNSLKSFMENGSKEGNKYLAWYLNEVDNKNIALNKEFGEVYIKFFNIKPIVLAYTAISTNDLEAEQDVDFVNRLIDYCYNALPEDNKNALSFTSNIKKDRITLLESNIDICIEQLQKRSDLTRIDDELIPKLKGTFVNSFWGGL